MAVSGIFLALQMAALYFEMNAGGVLGYYLLSAADYNTTTGIWLAEGGFTAVLRIDAAGVLLALPLSFHQLGLFAIARGIVFVVTVPLLMGTLEHYYAVLKNRVRPLSTVFRWYLDLRLTAKAIGLGLVLELIKWGTRLLGAVPALALIIWTTGRNLETSAASGLTLLAAFLFLAGSIASYWAYTLVLPARYLLVREPDSSFGHVLSAGVRVFRGRRLDFFLFRLSFLLWYVIVNITYGALGLFVQPYFELANLLYLQSATAPGPDGDLPVQP